MKGGSHQDKGCRTDQPDPKVTVHSQVEEESAGCWRHWAGLKAIEGQYVGALTAICSTMKVEGRRMFGTG